MLIDSAAITEIVRYGVNDIVLNFTKNNHIQQIGRVIKYHPAYFSLPINQIGIYNFCCYVPNIILSTYPRHLMIGFELFRHAFTLRYLINQPREHFLCLFVNIGKVAAQLAACE